MKTHMSPARQRVHSAATLLCAAFVAGTAALAQAAQPAADNAASISAAAEASNTADGTSRRERRRAERAAADTTTDTAAGESGSETVEARLVCKNIKLSGTRIAKPICGRPEQWEAAERRTSATAEEGMRQMRERSAVGAAHTVTTSTAQPTP